MRKKQSIFSLLLAVLTLSLSSLCVQAADSAQQEQALEKGKTVVYYFHGNMRCRACKQIETLTQKTVQEHFAQEVQEGSVELKSVNVDQSDNAHFVQDYELATRSVVVSRLEGGKEVSWRRLDQVWRLVRNENAFIDYLSKEITGLSQGGS
jgi:hypothetical protein